MPNEYRVTLVYKTEDKLTESGVALRIHEALDDSPSADVVVENVVQVRDND